jgi:hypothetical protein
MLSPDKRHSLIDLFQPPPGFYLEAAIGTAYSVQLDVLTAVVLALVGSDAEQAEKDPAALLHAIGRLRDRLRLFVHQGGIQTERQGHRLFALYDGFVRTVPLEEGTFHPKLWILKFAPRKTPELRDLLPEYRLLCMSRNLTDSHCWELGAVLSGSLGEAATPFGRDLSAFCEALLARDPARAEAVDGMVGDLRRLRLHGLGSQEARLFWQWPGRSKPGPLHQAIPTHAKRAMVLSPFVRGELVRRLAQAGSLDLVSTQLELDALPEAAHAALAHHRVYVLETPEMMDAALSGGLHAKLYLFDEGEERVTWIGSANATNAAFGIGTTNVETMLELRPGLPITSARREFIEADGALHPWLQKYQRRPLPDDPESRAERAMEAAIRHLDSLVVRATYDATLQSLGLTFNANPQLMTTGSSIRMEVAPYLLLRSPRADAWRALSTLPIRLEWAPVAHEDLSTFVLIRVSDLEGRCAERTFGVQIVAQDLEPFRPRRDEHLVRELIAGMDPATVLARIFGQFRGLTGTLANRRPSSGESGSSDPAPFLQGMTVEAMLEACTEDETRIAEVDNFLRTFADTVNPSFVQLWATFKAAHADILKELR